MTKRTITLQDQKEQVLSMLADIESTKDSDPEHARGMRDNLYEDALKWIASGKCSDPEYIARIVLRARKIKLAWE